MGSQIARNTDARPRPRGHCFAAGTRYHIVLMGPARALAQEVQEISPQCFVVVTGAHMCGKGLECSTSLGEKSVVVSSQWAVLLR